MDARRVLRWIPILWCLGNLVLGLGQIPAMQRGVFDSAARSSTPQPAGPYYALLVGIDKYHYLSPLKQP
jgi:hypothetical protein